MSWIWPFWILKICTDSEIEPILPAAQSGRVAVVRFLLDHGAKVDAMGDGGRAILNAARDNAEIAAMIQQ